MKYLTRFLQLLTTPLMKLIFSLVVNQRNIKLNSDDIRPDEPSIIISNHQGAIDGMVICYLLPFSVQLKQTPYRFMMSNKFFAAWIFTPIYIAWGIFPAKPHRLFKSGLNYAQSLLEGGQTLMIFPEGKVGQFDKQYPPRRGIEVLANETGVQLIPARVRWTRSKGLIKSYSLVVGKPFSGKHMTAEQIMDVVYDLKFS